jgi:hypothetical protein
MISYEWQPGNYYGHFQAPRYSIISYTWGRWKVQTHEESQYTRLRSLKVHGVPWEVPKIKEELFTLSQFEAAIQSCVAANSVPRKQSRSAERLDFIWVDVACISQPLGSDPIAKKEIGRQAKIFQRAQRALIWLAGNSVFVNGPSTSPQELLFALNQLSPSRGFKTTDMRDEKILSHLQPVITKLLGLPWFTSLWTLQEAYLRRDAIFLDPNGSIISENGVPYALSDLVGSLYNIIRDYTQESPDFSSSYLSQNRSLSTPLRLEVVDAIHKTGLQAMLTENPVSIYVMSQHRTVDPMYPLDRVYGIMQVFRFRLGESASNAPHSATYTLLDLEIQLGTALIQKYNFLSQIHVHRQVVTGGQAWRISKSSIVPAFWDGRGARGDHFKPALVADDMVQLSVKLVHGVHYGYFQGIACDFAYLYSVWNARDTWYVRTTTSPISHVSSFRLALDETHLFNQHTLQVSWPLYEIPWGASQRYVGQRMVDILSQNNRRAKVLLIGYYNNELSQTKGAKVLFGLLLTETYDSRTGPWWMRLGICTWDMPGLGETMAHDTLLIGGEQNWVLGEGLFG